LAQPDGKAARPACAKGARAAHGHRTLERCRGMAGGGSTVSEVGGGGRRKHEGGHGSTPGKVMEGGAHRSGPTLTRWQTSGGAAAPDGSGLWWWPVRMSSGSCCSMRARRW
jgi:hypothetical protein